MSESEDGGAGQREVAYRLFAAEFDDADFSYSESDEERAPNYVVTPTGARVNRLFVVGVLTEVEQVGDEVLRARVVDPTGAFVLYAGQYQPDEMAFLDRAETPSFVAVTGKARTFQPEDSDAVYTSIRPESISTVDAATRDRWTVQTAEQTLTRIEHVATALSLDASGDVLTETLLDHGVDEGLAAGIPLAIDHYGTTPAYLSALRETALDAARVVSGDIDEVESFSVAPDDEGPADLTALADSSVEVSAGGLGTEPSEPEPTESATAEEPSPDESTVETAEPAEASEDEAESETEPSTEPVEQSEAASAPEEPVGTDTESTEEPETESAAAETAAPPEESEASEAATTSEEDATATEPAAGESEDDDLGDFEPGEFELDEDEREEIEEEFGTEFQTGTDVPEPGEADIETPDPEELAEQEAADGDGAETDAAPAGGTTAVETEDAETSEVGAETAEAESELEVSETESEDGETEAEDGETESEAVEPAESTEPAEAEPAEDVDIDDAVVEVMEELDDGTGAERAAVVDTVVERYAATPDEVEDAIQDALMSGQCYEPDDETLKSI
ncbi:MULTISPECIES: hypothetical protein [Salinibaculum]|uniref:hypothetical protein n=1 Tax=Salinibaculum TaxID=2732368 RepID=UPI0030CCECE9